MAGIYKIIGIKKPGTINAMVAGKFQDVNLHTAPDEVLEELLQKGCPYIQLSPAEYAKRNKGMKKIGVDKIKANHK